VPDASTRSLPLAPVVIVLVMVTAGAFAFVGCGDDGLPTDYCCPCLPGERLPGCEDACDACEDEVAE
jgi:hypothetical protein